MSGSISATHTSGGAANARAGTLLTGQIIYTVGCPTDYVQNVADPAPQLTSCSVPHSPGTLDSVVIGMQYHVTSALQIETLTAAVQALCWAGAAPPPFFGGGVNDIDMRLYKSDGTTLLAHLHSQLTNTFDTTATGFDGNQDYGGPDSVSLGNSVTASGTAITITDAATLAYFASGTVNMKYYVACPFWYGCSSASFAVIWLMQFAGQIVVTYNYH